MSKKKHLKKIELVEKQTSPIAKKHEKTYKKGDRQVNKTIGQSVINGFLFGDVQLPGLQFLIKYPLLFTVLPLIVGIVVFFYAINASDVKPSISLSEELAKAQAVLNSEKNYSNKEEFNKELLEAGNMIKNVISKQPTNAKAYISLGVYHINLKQADSAFYSFQKALELDNGKSYISQNAHNYLLNSALNYGSIMIQQNNFQNVVDMVHRALRFHPKNEDLYSMAAYAYYQLGLIDSSRIFYKQVLSINPQNKAAAQYLNILSN